MGRSADVTALAADALSGNKRAIARTVSRFEDTRATSRDGRSELLSTLRNAPNRRRARFVGITGTPGAGKSTLVGALAKAMVERFDDKRIAVLAVDPASAISGGALLGDRTRVRFPTGEQRLFFRSQSSALALGGLGRHTFQVCRALDTLFDWVFVETVGIGQSEVEIRALADDVYLVMAPLGGDQVQFMKAGIMEIPDAFVLNKCDEESAAKRSLASLRASLRFARPQDEARVPIFTTSAVSGRGVAELLDDIVSRDDGAQRGAIGAEPLFFRRWVEDAFGRAGTEALSSFNLSGDFDADQQAFGPHVTRCLNDRFGTR